MNSRVTPTEALVRINKLKDEHERLKSDIISITHNIDSLEKEVNRKLERVKTIESEYVTLIEIINTAE